MALDALLDPSIELVILTGPAGCGKTLLALASALEMIIEKGIYDKVIVTRNTPEIAESIGFLPGTEEEKMAPWLAAITDTLEVLHKGDENPISSRNYIMEKANVQFKSVNFMRGRSIQNAVVILQPRIGGILKFLPPCFYWPVEKVKRISKKIDYLSYSEQSLNNKPLLKICNLQEKYNTKPSNDSIFWEAA